LPDRATYRFYDYVARCDDCGWESWTRNSQGNAAKHCDRYGHTVHIEVVGGITYTPRGSPWEIKKLAGDAERIER
jgi:hypothetical protein